VAARFEPVQAVDAAGELRPATVSLRLSSMATTVKGARSRSTSSHSLRELDERLRSSAANGSSNSASATAAFAALLHGGRDVAFQAVAAFELGPQLLHEGVEEEAAGSRVQAFYRFLQPSAASLCLAYALKGQAA
jgi:1,6-anhydro-N-acetylmuramate kinase